MRTLHRPGIVCIGLLFLMSCASEKLHMITPSNEGISVDSGLKRLFLVGDAGEDTEGFRENMALLRQRIMESEIPAVVVFLGDNVYPHGIPNKEDSLGYRAGVEILQAQIDAVQDVASETVFIPGNHDWNRGHKGGLKAIRRQGKLVNASAEARMLPKKGCPGPEVVELTNDVVLIIIDSQWWLQDWRTESDINDNCGVRTRAGFLLSFAETLKDYKEQQIIVAMHHPLVSSGTHGGYFTVRDHLFPLTNIGGLRHFYLPLPVIGSIYPLYRGNLGNVQDQVHQKYDALIRGLEEATRYYDNVVFVAGHEHGLEYHKKENHQFLVSGSGSKTTPLGKPKSMLFGHPATGFMQLNLEARGALDLMIWEGAHPQVPVYRTRMSDGVVARLDDAPLPMAELPDTILMPVSTEFEKSGFHRLLFGERYRDIYAIPSPARVVDLSEEKGGLTPVKTGGGFQTNSLRLLGPGEKEYSARSMNKDATKLLPQGLQNTFASDLLQDQFTASHPYAAFVIPDLADAAGIYHTNPELVFIPKQTALGRYSKEYGDQLYLLEERPSEEWCGNKGFGNCSDIIGFDDLIENTMDDYRDVVDQEFTARSRMFDMFLGDWDRHDDQWRWAEFDRTDGKGHFYRPIPRDRDQAFALYDGLLVSAAQMFTSGIRKLNRFSPDIKNYKWFNDNGKIFDRDFTNALTRAEWIAIATDLQSAISDTDIEQSIRQLPPKVYEEGGAKIETILKARRDHLPKFAEEYYDVLAKTVMIRCTNNADFIEIDEEPRKLTVRIYDSNKEGEKHEKYYDRTFLKGETHEVQIYGLEGHDRISVMGPGKGGIRVHVVGGEDKDRIEMAEAGSHGKLCFQDTEEKTEVTQDKGVRYRKVNDDQNTYVRSAFLYDYGIPKAIIAINPDDGLLLGGGAQWVKHGFQKHPYASKHTFGGFYAFETSSWGLRYSGEWVNVFGGVNVGLDAAYEGPTFTQNFFGFGNESVQQSGEELEYYRVRKGGYSIVPFIRFGEEIGSSVKFRAGLQGHEVEKSSGRFVSTPEAGLPDFVFEDNRFFVTGLEYRFDVTGTSAFVARGMDFRLGGGLDVPLNGDNQTHRYARASWATYFQLKHLGRPVIAMRLGTEFHGGDYQFYQGAVLGSQGNFRGMPKQRLVGDKFFYHNIDLRFPLTKWKGYVLPASLGLQLNFDYGRVWLRNEDSNTWHYAYGGGIWLNLFDSFLLTVSYHESDLDQRFSVGTGFLF